MKLTKFPLWQSTTNPPHHCSQVFADEEGSHVAIIHLDIQL